MKLLLSLSVKGSYMYELEGAGRKYAVFLRGNKCLSTCRSFRTTAPSKLSSAAIIWRSMSVSGSVWTDDIREWCKQDLYSLTRIAQERGLWTPTAHGP